MGIVSTQKASTSVSKEIRQIVIRSRNPRNEWLSPGRDTSTPPDTEEVRGRETRGNASPDDAAGRQ